MNNKSIALRAKLKAENRIELRLIGRCMYPLLVADDHVAIVPLTDLCVGSLYLIKLPTGELAVHRLVKLFESAAICKGDRAVRYETLLKECLIGQVNEVKLKGANTWHSVSTGKKTSKLISGLSLAICKDKSKTTGAILASIRRVIALVILDIYSRCKRLAWLLFL